MGSFIRFLMMAILATVLAGCGDRRSARDDDGDDEAQNLTTNTYALHDSSSDQYRDDCLSCHSEVLTEESLDSSIPSAHTAMLAETPGGDTQSKCVYCHTSVDLLQHSAGNIRRQVSVETCDLCHGPGGTADEFQYYQD